MDWWFIAPIQLVILGMVHYCFTNITRAKHRALPCFLGRIKLLNWFTSPNNNAKNHVKKNRCWKISARLRHESSYSPLQFCRQWWYDHFPMKNHSHLIYSNFWPWHIVRWVVVLKIKAIKMMLQMPRTRTFVPSLCLSGTQWIWRNPLLFQSPVVVSMIAELPLFSFMTGLTKSPYHLLVLCFSIFSGFGTPKSIQISHQFHSKWQ